MPEARQPNGSPPATQPYATHLLSLPLEQRRRALAIDKSRVLAELEDLRGCQRCNFVQHILSVFVPDMPAPLDGAALPAAHMMAILAPRSERELVSLLQFSWRDHGSVTLADSLLREDRLLLAFMRDALHVVQDLRSEVGDCSRHHGLPGPAELDRTATRLRQQEQDVLASLQDLGVLRPPSGGGGGGGGAAFASPSGRAPDQSRTPGTATHLSPRDDGRPRSGPHHQPGSAAAAFAAAAAIGRQQASAGGNGPSSSPAPPAPPALFVSPRDMQGGQGSGGLTMGGAQGLALLARLDQERIAALPEAQQERATQLRHTLMQVHSRQARLARALEHGVAAAGKRVLLALLSHCWEALLRDYHRGACPDDALARLLATQAQEHRIHAETRGSDSFEGELGQRISGSGGAAQRDDTASDAGGRSGRHSAQAAAPPYAAHKEPVNARRRLPLPSAVPPAVDDPSSAVAWRPPNEAVGGRRPASSPSPGNPTNTSCHSSAEPEVAASGTEGRGPRPPSRRDGTDRRDERSGHSGRDERATAGEGAAGPRTSSQPSNQGYLSAAGGTVGGTADGTGHGADNRREASGIRGSGGRDEDRHCSERHGGTSTSAPAPPPLAAAAPPAGGTGLCRGADCVAARTATRCEVAALSSHLARCQVQQRELQESLHQALEQLGQSQRDSDKKREAEKRECDKVVADTRRKLLLWQGDPSALRGLAAEDLEALTAAVEGNLTRIRAAHVQAVSDRELLCPVCWDERKDLVFNCGHQTCVACGERVAVCPICRGPVTLRIKVY